MNNLINPMPVSYGLENIYNSNQHPSELHADSGIKRYFQRYYIQKVMSVFEWSGIPENWSKDYFLYSLYLWGYVAIVNTDKYGVIPQWCTLRGRDIFYRPTNAVITNPLLNGMLEPRIGEECALIRFMPDYGGISDIISYYSDLMALYTQTLSINVVNSKLSYIAGASNKAMAETLKKIYDEMASGKPAVVYDKELYNEQGRPLFELFLQNLSQNYISDRLLEDMAKVDSRFNTEIGVPNVNIAKESGVSNGEVQANNFDTKSKASVWLETMKDGVEVANRLFNLNLGVEFKEMRENVEKSIIDTRTLSI